MAAMLNHAALAAIALFTGSVTGGMALGNFATGDWHYQRASAFDPTADFTDETYMAPPTVAPVAVTETAAVSGPHQCTGCDAGRHLRGRWRDGMGDAYEADYGAGAPPITPDAFAVEDDWGGGRPVARQDMASYRVIEDAPAPKHDAVPEKREATVMASATPPPLPTIAYAQGAAAPN